MPRPEKGKVPEHLKPFQWKKGQSGNPKGRPRGRILSESYLRLLNTDLGGKGDIDARIEEVVKVMIKDGAKIADFVALAQIKEALDGKTHAASEIADRVEGKPKQTQEIVGPGEGPLQAIGLDLAKLSSDDLRDVVSKLGKAIEDEGGDDS